MLLTVQSLSLAKLNVMPLEQKQSMKTPAKRGPFVTVKVAQSLDGRIATTTGDSQWITGTEARSFAHQLRSEHDAILVGIGTVLKDDPQLTVRLVEGSDPLRIVVDTHLRIPATAKVLANRAAHHTLIVTSKSADAARVSEIEKLGAEVLRCAAQKNGLGIDLVSLLGELGARNIRSVLVEGGKGIVTSLLRAGAVDRVVAIIAPKIIGQGIEAIGDLGFTSLNDAIVFSSVSTRRLGSDIVIDGRIK